MRDRELHLFFIPQREAIWSSLFPAAPQTGMPGLETWMTNESGAQYE